MADLIYIVEDEENIRELICASLRVSGFDIQDYESSKGLFSELKHKIPNLVILDIMLPEESGFDILKKMRAIPEYMLIPVIFLTAKSSEIDKVTGLDLGADDFIVKPFGVLELNSRVKAVIRRYSMNIFKQEEHSVIFYKDLTIKSLEKCVLKNNDKLNLTYKEYELLLYLYKNRGIVLSREKLLFNVWNQDYEGETRTVDVHIKSLRSKIGDNGDNDYISTIRGHGYMLIKE